jgi:hypothetical protein
MQKKVTLERDQQRQVVVLRQMPHGKPAIVGKQFSFAGKRWIVTEVREAQ